MLIDLMTGEQITRIPYQRDFEAYMARMSAGEIQSIEAALNANIDGTNIQTAGWMPGADWTDTVFWPIFDKAARRDYQASAKCFGLMVWKVFMDRSEKWCSGRFEKDGEPIGSRTYFRVDG